MARGVKKPAKIHKLEGTFRADRHVEELEGDALNMEMPGYFNDYQKEAWKITVDQLEKWGILENVTYPLLVSYCHYIGLQKQAQEQLAKQGPVIVESTKNGKIAKKNPWMFVLNESTEFIRKIGTEFGITPRSRGNISVKEKKELNPLESLKQKYGQ